MWSGIRFRDGSPNTTRNARMFEFLQPVPPDPILGLTEAWKADLNPDKVNLGVGVYQNETGDTPVLECVKASEAAVLAQERTKTYLPISGDPEFGRQVEALLFPDGKVADRLCTAHAPGGTGALRVGADLMRSLGAGPTVWVSAPTWTNHNGVFEAAGFRIESYPYYRATTRDVDAQALLAALDRIPAGHLVVLHAACHNPSGADPDPALWTQIAQSAVRTGWIPFLDNAYLGFGRGLKSDQAALDVFLRSGSEFLVATSFSKNLGLYRERVGALTVAAKDRKARDAVFSRVKKTVRALYSSPPSHGGEIVRRVLSDPVLRDLWGRELDGMRDRIRAMRAAFAAGMKARRPEADFEFVTRQTGMFSFSGLGAEQTAWLRTEKSLYMTSDGRINVAGLTPANLDRVCDALCECLDRCGVSGTRQI